MKAAVLGRFGEPLMVETVPEPVIGTDEVLVDVVATNILPYSAEIVSNARRYPIALPMVLGTGAIAPRLRRSPEGVSAAARPLQL